MIRKLFYLFLFFSPFTSFFAISAWLRLPVVINQILFIALVIGVFQQGRLKTKWIYKEDILALLFLALVWFSFLIGFKEQRSFNHSLAYTNSILFFFFLIKYVISFLELSSFNIAKIIYRSFICISIIIILDFVGKNYFDLSLRLVFSSLDGVISNMNYYIRAGMFHVGGVAEEPGHMALFYNIYGGISLYYVHLIKSRKRFYVLIGLFIICHFALFSNAGIVLPILAVTIIFLVNKFEKLVISKKQLFWLTWFVVFLLGSLVWFLLSDFGKNSFINEFVNKILFLEDEVSSSGARLTQWTRALNNYVIHPIFGHGPGFGVHEDQEGYLSVYLTILADLGILAFLTFLAFQLSIFIKIFKLKGRDRNYLLFCLITASLHLSIIADFYHAPIWILLIFAQLVYKENVIETK